MKNNFLTTTDMKMKKRYKQACDHWFSKKVSKEMMYHIENNYGFDDEDLNNVEIQYNILCLFRDVYFEDQDENYLPKDLVESN
jgi:hypothetical protein